MTTETISVAEARSEFSSLLSQVELLHRRFIIAHRGRPKAVLINVDDLARLETATPTQSKGNGQSEGNQENEPNERPFRPVRLPEGLLADYDFPPDAIEQARRIMWPDRSDALA